MTTMLGPPKMFLDYTQSELDDAYDQNKWVADRQAAWRQRAERSEAVRAMLGEPLRLSYGPTEMEASDIFLAASGDGPTVILLHGGAWLRGSAADYEFAAAFFTNAGVNYAVPDFDSVETAGGELDVMVEQVRRAVISIWGYLRDHGSDRRLYLCGHSSGAHLAACLLTTDWARDGLPGDVITGSVCMSGLYDLRGARLSARSRYVNFRDDVEARLSPARHAAAIPCPVLLAYGTQDSPEFQRMGWEFAAALAAQGRLFERIVGEGLGHFSLLETFDGGLLGNATLRLMGIPGDR